MQGCCHVLHGYMQQSQSAIDAAEGIGTLWQTVTIRGYQIPHGGIDEGIPQVTINVRGHCIVILQCVWTTPGYKEFVQWGYIPLP